MGVQSLDGERATGATDILAVAFGTTVAMWAVGYVGHMPLADLSPFIFVSGMLVCVTVGGWIIGKKTLRGVRGGLQVGLIVGILNLLVLGSASAKQPNTGQIVPSAVMWIPGYFLLFAALGAIGAMGGSARRIENVATSPDWLGSFAWIASVATLLLISAGGLVTGFRAGMAVPDWPNTYGSNMFLYPLAKMTGGVFYEHTHRLLGSLVGLTSLTLAILLSIHRRSIGALILIWIVGSCVLFQGILGGFRVTDNSAHLAVVHGFFAHLILAGMVGVAVLLYPRSRMKRPLDDQAAPNQSDGTIATALVLAVLSQTLIGTFVRQLDIGLIAHITVALLVAILTIAVGMRLWGLYPHISVFARGGVGLMCIVLLQLTLGGTSLVFRTPPAVASPSAEQLQLQADALRPATHALLTTAHQTTAAVLLSLATLLAFWSWRYALSGDASIREALAPEPTHHKLQ